MKFIPDDKSYWLSFDFSSSTNMTFCEKSLKGYWTHEFLDIHSCAPWGYEFTPWDQQSRGTLVSFHLPITCFFFFLLFLINLFWSFLSWSTKRHHRVSLVYTVHTQIKSRCVLWVTPCSRTVVNKKRTVSTRKGPHHQNLFHVRLKPWTHFKTCSESANRVHCGYGEECVYTVQFKYMWEGIHVHRL